MRKINREMDNEIIQDFQSWGTEQFRGGPERTKGAADVEEVRKIWQSEIVDGF